ncbi:hypothetical protein B0H13DRAFT_2301161 [Mycena leptocephala]|nr:hypothetical protein B0H13DRAFT_2301161 [Mycena leptocephala]
MEVTIHVVGRHSWYSWTASPSCSFDDGDVSSASHAVSNASHGSHATSNASHVGASAFSHTHAHSNSNSTNSSSARNEEVDTEEILDLGRMVELQLSPKFQARSVPILTQDEPGNASSVYGLVKICSLTYTAHTDTPEPLQSCPKGRPPLHQPLRVAQVALPSSHYVGLNHMDIEKKGNDRTWTEGQSGEDGAATSGTTSPNRSLRRNTIMEEFTQMWIK